MSTFSGSINADALIVRAISSDALVIYLYHEFRDIDSQAYITKAQLYSDAYITKETLVSDAHIVYRLSGSLDSDAYITKEQLSSDAIVSISPVQTITSDARILNSGSFPTQTRGALIVGAGTSISSSRGALIKGYGESSNETIVYDIFTSLLLDLTLAGTPNVYDTYDWAYDWATREWHGCIVKFEARQNDDSYAINGELWQEIQKGQIISRQDVKRYHQWRLHLWASGSRDFELHQFTIKAYVDNYSSALTTSIIF